jgi:hypothetical protein
MDIAIQTRDAKVPPLAGGNRPHVDPNLFTRLARLHDLALRTAKA